jgi:hypothetical protein
MHVIQVTSAYNKKLKPEMLSQPKRPELRTKSPFGRTRIQLILAEPPTKILRLPDIRSHPPRVVDEEKSVYLRTIQIV